MKKLIQISLIVVLVFAMFQAVIASPTVSVGGVGSHQIQTISSTANASAQASQMATCLGIKGLLCIVPNVGWNS